MTVATLASQSVGPEVWSRVWRHQPSDRRDDHLLARETSSPRWGLIQDALNRSFGSVKSLRTVELGSGRGDLSALLAQQDARVSLLDESDEALRQARHRFQRLRLQADFVAGDFFSPTAAQRATFDVALSSGVIEHFRGKQRTRAIRAHAQWVRPGGLVIISVPHAMCWTYRLWKMYLELRSCWPYGMEIPYTHAELLRRSREAGLEHSITRCTGFWQSFADHLLKTATGQRLNWTEKRSCLDRLFGVNLLLFGTRPQDSNES